MSGRTDVCGCAQTHKSPPTSLASSMSARPPVSRLTSRDRLTASQPASSSAEHASTAITPALSRPGLSSSTATAGSKAANWLARSGAASGPDGGGVRKGARRAQRAPPTQPPIHDAVLPGMEDGGEGVESGADKREDICECSARVAQRAAANFTTLQHHCPPAPLSVDPTLRPTCTAARGLSYHLLRLGWMELSLQHGQPRQSPSRAQLTYVDSKCWAKASHHGRLRLTPDSARASVPALGGATCSTPSRA